MTAPPTPRFAVGDAAFHVHVPRRPYHRQSDDAYLGSIVLVRPLAIHIENDGVGWTITYLVANHERYREEALHATGVDARTALAEELARARAEYVAQAAFLFDGPIVICDENGDRWTAPASNPTAAPTAYVYEPPTAAR